MENTKLLVLVSSMFASPKQVSEQSRALTILNSRNVDFEVIDGSDKTQLSRRNELFHISGARGQYPQFFLMERQGSTTYIGGFEALEGINEASSLPESILKEHPAILTWEKLLSGVGLSCQ